MSVREKLRGDMLAQMRRYPQRGWIAGVCVGLSEYFNWNVKLVRLLLVVAGLCTKVFPLAIVYLVLWYLMDPADTAAAEEPAAAAQNPAAGAAAAAAAPNTSSLKTRFARLEQRLSSMEECIVSKDFELRQELRKLES
jgi:phage shock protein C